METSLLLSNVIDVNYQNLHLLQTMPNLHHSSRFLKRFSLTFISDTLPIALMRTLEQTSVLFQLKVFDHYDAFWLPSSKEKYTN